MGTTLSVDIYMSRNSWRTQHADYINGGEEFSLHLYHWGAMAKPTCEISGVGYPIPEKIKEVGLGEVLSFARRIGLMRHCGCDIGIVKSQLDLFIIFHVCGVDILMCTPLSHCLHLFILYMTLHTHELYWTQ